MRLGPDIPIRYLTVNQAPSGAAITYLERVATVVSAIIDLPLVTACFLKVAGEPAFVAPREILEPDRSLYGRKSTSERGRVGIEQGGVARRGSGSGCGSRAERRARWRYQPVDEVGLGLIPLLLDGERRVSDGSGTAAGSAVGNAGDVGGDAALARARVLRPAAGGADQRPGSTASSRGSARRTTRARRGRPSLPPGRYFRMLLVGYFEGIDSERGLEWRCADSLSLREFLRLGEREPVPDHSWLSRTRARLPLEVHDAGVQLGAAAPGRARPDQGRADRRRCLDHGGQRRAARDRAARQRRGLPRDADAHGQGERHRDADGRGPDPAGSQTQRQEAVQRGVGEPDRSGCPDRQAEGRPHAPGLQARARDGSRHRRGGRGRDASGRPGRHRDPAGHPGECRPAPRRGRGGAERRGALPRWWPTKATTRARC